jgi:hypothetical protein
MPATESTIGISFGRRQASDGGRGRTGVPPCREDLGQLRIEQDRRYRRKGTRTGENLTIARVAERLVVRFFRGPGTGPKPIRKRVERQREPELIRVLSRSSVPLTAKVIAERLSQGGVRRNALAVHNALVRRPEIFVHVRKNGFMLRSNWEKPAVRYFLTTEEIVQMAREVLDKTRAPMRPAEIIEQFHAHGRRIYGDELGSLRTVLQKHSEHFEAKGRQYARWILRPFAEPDYVRIAA